MYWPLPLPLVSKQLIKDVSNAVSAWTDCIIVLCRCHYDPVHVSSYSYNTWLLCGHPFCCCLLLVASSCRLLTLWFHHLACLLHLLRLNQGMTFHSVPQVVVLSRLVCVYVFIVFKGLIAKTWLCYVRVAHPQWVSCIVLLQCLCSVVHCESKNNQQYFLFTHRRNSQCSLVQFCQYL